MKCEQFLCINHNAAGCGRTKCKYFSGELNEINAAIEYFGLPTAPTAQMPVNA